MKRNLVKKIAERRGIMKNTLLTFLMFALFTLAIVPLEAKAAEFTTADIVILSDMNQFGTVDAVDSRTITSSNNSDVKIYYLELNLKETSWVYFTGNHSLYNHEDGRTDVVIYSNKSMNNKIGDFEWGFLSDTSKHVYSNFLNAGTYYLSVSTYNNWNSSGTFTGNVNIMAAAVPVSTIFKTSIDVASDKGSAAVSFKNALGKYIDYVEYQAGAVALSSVNDTTYWRRRDHKDQDLDYWSGNKNAQVLIPSNDTYSFTASSNSDYTIMVQTTDGNRYSDIITVSGLAPTTVEQPESSTTAIKQSEVSVSSANSKAKKKVYLKWKKNKYADGYKVYRSTKKKTGYKCIATLNKKSKVSYTDKNVKSKKVYYYKVRAYRKNGKKTIYSGYSPVKRVKVK